MTKRICAGSPAQPFQRPPGYQVTGSDVTP